MKINIKGTWGDVKASARTTIGKEGEGLAPSLDWKRTILLAEHSPIRKLHFSWKWLSLPYWVSVHFVRHKFGIEHWVSTQRTDRTGVDRTDKPQSAKVMHECEANAQAIINISRKRLCAHASNETRAAWLEVLEGIREQDEALFSCCVPECLYRGFCPEFKSCGYVRTEAYREKLKEYRKGHEVEE